MADLASRERSPVLSETITEVTGIGGEDSDITMLATSNSEERDQDDWEKLLQDSDPRFKLEEVKRIPDAKLDLIIARSEGGA
ncbi:MAG: hypothetical protein Q9203_003291 [Teloschistes exilis]